MRVRTAAPGDRLAVVRLLDAANLETDLETVDRRLEAGTVLVAGDPPAGTLVVRPTGEGAHVAAVAVRKSRQGRGVGSALVGAAVERWGRLTAAFDPGVGPFYESLGFDIEAREDGRLWATLEDALD